MAGTNPQNRRGAQGAIFRENLKTPEDRALNELNKKRKYDERLEATGGAREPRPYETPEGREMLKQIKRGRQRKQKAEKGAASENGPAAKKARVEGGADEESGVDEEAEKGKEPEEEAGGAGNVESSGNATNAVSWPPTLPPSPLTAQLERDYALTPISVMSSSSIQKKTTQVLGLLSTYPTPEGQKPALVVLRAKAKVASKMITVVEICKRDISGRKGKWYQYSDVVGVVEELPAKHKEGHGDEGEDGEEEEEESFETMKTPFERAIEGQPKVREVPHMMVYLSRIRVESLRKVFGEQTNGLEDTSGR